MTDSEEAFLNLATRTSFEYYKPAITITQDLWSKAEQLISPFQDLLHFRCQAENTAIARIATYATKLQTLEVVVYSSSTVALQDLKHCRTLQKLVMIYTLGTHSFSNDLISLAENCPKLQLLELFPESRGQTVRQWKMLMFKVF